MEAARRSPEADETNRNYYIVVVATRRTTAFVKNRIAKTIFVSLRIFVLYAYTCILLD